MLNAVFYNDDDKIFKACTSSAMETEVNLTRDPTDWLFSNSFISV